jgi:hypothetical protein
MQYNSLCHQIANHYGLLLERGIFRGGSDFYCQDSIEGRKK